MGAAAAATQTGSSSFGLLADVLPFWPVKVASAVSDASDALQASLKFLRMPFWEPPTMFSSKRVIGMSGTE